MNLDIPALATGLLGGGSIGTVIAFVAWFKVERRRRRAEARKTEMEGDLLSIEYFTKTINELVEDNKQLKAEVRQLQRDVEELKEGKSDLADQLDKYKEASRKLKDCPNHENCPIAKEYHKLIGKEE